RAGTVRSRGGGANVSCCNVFARQQPSDPFLQVLGGIVRVGDGKNLSRPRVRVTDQLRDAPFQDCSLAGAGPGDDQHRAVYMFNRRFLPLIEMIVLDRHGLGTRTGNSAGALPLPRTLASSQLS